MYYNYFKIILLSVLSNYGHQLVTCKPIKCTYRINCGTLHLDKLFPTSKASTLLVNASWLSLNFPSFSKTSKTSAEGPELAVLMRDKGREETGRDG